jgi:hypothetical protein
MSSDGPPGPGPDGLTPEQLERRERALDLAASDTRPRVGALPSSRRIKSKRCWSLLLLRRYPLADNLLFPPQVLADLDCGRPVGDSA